MSSGLLHAPGQSPKNPKLTLTKRFLVRKSSKNFYFPGIAHKIVLKQENGIFVTEIGELLFCRTMLAVL